MNDERRHQVRVISNLLDTLATELARLAEDERRAYDRMPPVAQYGDAGDHSSDAQSILADAASDVSNHAFKLFELTEKPFG
jgi:hypothetical protein